MNEAREARRLALGVGRARGARVSPQIWLWIVLGLSAFVIVYWRFAQSKLESQKSAVMAKQRAVMQALGPKIIPFCDKIERWVFELSGEPAPNLAAPDLSLEAVANGPGVYLRLRGANAKNTKALRSAAARSLRDGFTSCLFVRREETQGPGCKSPSDCTRGLVCNDWGICARPSQPYNLRLAYRALRILSSEWTDELHQATNDLAVRAFELDFEAVTRNDIPVAIEVLSRARYFTVVLDEDPPSGLPPALSHGPGEAAETEEERIQRVPHSARVGVWDVRDDKMLVRLRGEAAGEFVPVGDRAPSGEATLAAERRQVNSCALALEVKELVAGSAAR